MGRKAVVIDRDELQAVVTEIEQRDKPASHSELWQLVGDSPWATNRERPYNRSTLQVKAKSLGIVINTPKGKLRSNSPPRIKGPRKKKSFALEVVHIIEKEFAPLGEKTVNSLIDGKMSAAIKAKCWDCSGHQKVEVANCTVLTCPLWPHRPWRKLGETNNEMPHSMDDSEGYAGSDSDFPGDEPSLE